MISDINQVIDPVLFDMFEYSIKHSSKEVLRYILDKAELLTGSTIGFYHFVNEKDQSLTLQMWSTNTIKNMCQAEGEGMNYPIESAGVWVDAIRKRRPVIHNDYETLTHKKGLPEGHAKVIREVVVPVMRGGEVVAVLGVGNKLIPYNNTDVEVLLSFANLAHETVIKKQREEEIQEKKDELVEYINGINDIYFGLDENLNYIYWNEAAELLTGITSDQVKGKSWYDLEINQGYEWIGDIYRRTVETGNSQIFEVSFPASTIHSSSHYLVKTYRIKNGLTVLLQDITHIKEIQTRLEQSEEKYKRFFNLTSEGIVYFEMSEPLPKALSFNDQLDWIVNKSILKECNHNYAILNGFQDADEIIDKTMWSYQPDKNATFNVANAFIKHDYKLANMEYQKTLPNGKSRIYLASALGVEDQKFVYAFWGIIRDITEMKKIESKIIEMDKLKAMSTLAGGLAHDFNNILTGLSLNLSLIETKTENEAIINDIKYALKRGSSMVNQLLHFSKSQEPRKIYTNIDEILNFSARLSTKGSNYTFTLDIEDNLPKIHVDVGQIEQVITNLVLNAEQAMPEGGNVNIRVEKVSVDADDQALTPGKYLMISVTDTGVGIPESYQDKIFEPYFSSKASGTGLGLFSSNAIIKKHDGKITFSSKQGEGSTFFVYLPIS